MFCRKCGCKIIDGDLFCTECGEPIAKNEKVLESNITTEETIVQNEVENNMYDEAFDEEKTAVFNEPLEESGTETIVSQGKNKGSLIKRIAIPVALLVVVVGAALYFTLDRVEALPHEYDEAVKFYEEKIEKIDTAYNNKEYAELAELTNGTEKIINDVLLSENSDEPYEENIVDLSLDIEEKVVTYKMNSALPALKELNEAGNTEDMCNFYSSEMLQLDDKDKIIDLVFYAMAEEGQFDRAENALKGLVAPFSKEAFERVREYQSYLEEEYPDRDRAWEKVDMKKYDKLMKFNNGMAKVGIKVGGSGVDTIYDWGMVDTEGNEVLKTDYNMIGEYSEGLAAVQKDGKWGFVDENGNVVIDFIYDDLKDTQDAVIYAYAKRDPEMVSRGFYEGFATVKKDGKWGYIDKSGKPLGAGIVYQDAWYFNEGVATVEIDEKYGLIDTTGRYIIKPDTYSSDGIKYDVIRTIYEGLAGANWGDRKQRGIIDKNGYLVTEFDPMEIDLVQDFREGLACARYDEKWGFINTYGDIVIQPQYDSVTVFINGVSKVSQNGKYGLINREGGVLLPIVYEGIGAFKNDYAIVKLGEKYGFADQQGKLICDIKYQNARDFENGFAGVKEGGKWGVIDENGKIVIDPIFDDMKSFSNGLAPAKIGEKWGYVDINGYFLVAPEFEKADSFYEGMAGVVQDGEHFYIKLKDIVANTQGQVVSEDGETIQTAMIKVYDADAKGLLEAIYTAKSDDEGMYNLLVPKGNYRVVVSMNGFINGISYEDVSEMDNNYVNSIVLVKGNADDEKTAKVSVVVGDALNGKGISDAEIKFRAGFNNMTGKYIKDEENEVICETTNKDGSFSVELPYGLYSAEVSLDGYTDARINFVAGAKSKEQQIMTKAMTEILNDGETRITLEWGDLPRDLDSHLFGPSANSTERFHIFYPVKNQKISNAMLDKDDTNGNGFETTTIYEQNDGVYEYQVFDFTNGGNYYSSQMSMSGARVCVYQKDRRVAVYDVPTNKTGTLWRVFRLDGNKIESINEMTNHMDTGVYQY